MATTWKEAIKGTVAQADELVISKEQGAEINADFPVMWRDNGDDSIEIKGNLKLGAEAGLQSSSPVILPDGYAVNINQGLSVEDTPQRNGIPMAVAVNGSDSIGMYNVYSPLNRYVNFHWVIKVSKA